MSELSPSSSLIDEIGSLAITLQKESLAEKHSPCVERCMDLLKRLEVITTKQNSSSNSKKEEAKTIVTVMMLEKTRVGKCLTKAIKSFHRHQRTADSKDEWQPVIQFSNRMLSSWKSAAEAEQQQKQKSDQKSQPQQKQQQGHPKSAAMYRNRLVLQKKELYKDPPALPPSPMTVFLDYDDDNNGAGLPKRNKKTSCLSFPSTTSCTDLIKEFHPNVTPEEVLRAGSFGGTYFRSISSAVTNISYKSSQVLENTLHPDWIAGLNKSTTLTSATYRASINKFKVKCGGSLGMWESSGWISDVDPYGWFQWYCRFYQGRRCSDDERQISRWMKSVGSKGRFRSQLCNKIIATNNATNIDDIKVSPVIRQTLLHWGLTITSNVMEQHRKRTGK